MDKKSLMNLVHRENEYITDLLLTYNVPDTIEDSDYEDYLISNNNNDGDKSQSQNLPWRSRSASELGSLEELQERLNIIKNKMKVKKHPDTEKARQRKKLRKNKQLKKVFITEAQSLKNEQSKQTGNNIEVEKQQNENVVNNVVTNKTFNEERKFVFSKIKFSDQQKNSHQNPRDILKQLNKADKKLNELKEKGEIEKAAEIKNKLSWKKAFDKVEGKKVKDDRQLLYKAIKKRKLEKKKSKKLWKERHQKVEHEITTKQKKRQENINKRIRDKQTRKLKRATKKGRVIPGF